MFSYVIFKYNFGKDRLYEDYLLYNIRIDINFFFVYFMKLFFVF